MIDRWFLARTADNDYKSAPGSCRRVATVAASNLQCFMCRRRLVHFLQLHACVHFRPDAMNADSAALVLTERDRMLRGLLGSCGERVAIEVPFRCDYGANVLRDRPAPP